MRSFSFDPEPVIRAIRALQDLHDSGDTTLEDWALEAAQANRPAYWTTAGYNDQTGMLVAFTANESGVAAALDQWTDEGWPAGGKSRTRLLSTLIPLNAAAKVELATLDTDELGEAA